MHLPAHDGGRMLSPAGSAEPLSVAGGGEYVEGAPCSFIVCGYVARSTDPDILPILTANAYEC